MWNYFGYLMPVIALLCNQSTDVLICSRRTFLCWFDYVTCLNYTHFMHILDRYNNILFSIAKQPKFFFPSIVGGCSELWAKHECVVWNVGARCTKRLMTIQLTNVEFTYAHPNNIYRGWDSLKSYVHALAFTIYIKLYKLLHITESWWVFCTPSHRSRNQHYMAKICSMQPFTISNDVTTWLLVCRKHLLSPHSQAFPLSRLLIT